MKEQKTFKELTGMTPAEFWAQECPSDLWQEDIDVFLIEWSEGFEDQLDPDELIEAWDRETRD